jgi:hypothetical protein
MGLFGDIWNGVKAFFGGSSNSCSSDSSSSTTVYEPDKVRIAEIKREKKLISAQLEQMRAYKEIELAKLEKDRELAVIELDRDKKIELVNLIKNKEIELVNLKAEKEAQLVKLNGEIKRAMFEAQINGLIRFNQSLSKLMEELNSLAQEQFRVMESASLEAIKEIESYYNELTKSVLEDRYSSDDKFIELLEQLERFPKDSKAYEIYAKKLDIFAEKEVEFFSNTLKDLKARQKMLIESTLDNKKTINSRVSQAIFNKIEDSSLVMEKSKVLIDKKIEEKI